MSPTILVANLSGTVGPNPAPNTPLRILNQPEVNIGLAAQLNQDDVFRAPATGVYMVSADVNSVDASTGQRYVDYCSLSIVKVTAGASVGSGVQNYTDPACTAITRGVFLNQGDTLRIMFGNAYNHAVKVTGHLTIWG